MAKIPYFPFYPDDWLSSPKVLAMSDAQRGIYIHLLAMAWKHPGCILPSDRKTLQLLCPRSKWKNIDHVMRECLQGHGVGLANMRLLAEHTKAIQKSEKARESVKYRKNRPLKESNDYRTTIERQSNQNQNQNQNHIKEESKEIGEKKKRFSPPSLEEVTDYCQERKNGIDPKAFLSFYESKGWMIGKNKMSSWRSAVGTWEAKKDGKSNKSFHERDVEEAARVRKAAGAFFGVRPGGNGLAIEQDQGKADRGTENPALDGIIDISQVEDFKA